LLAVAILVAVLFITRNSWLPAAGRWLDVGEQPVRTDYCVVLSGDYEQRPFVAAALYRREYIRRKIWLTLVNSGPCEDRVEPTIEGAVTHLFVVLGVPADRVAVLDGRCASTFDEARALASALDAEPTATVTIVTSNYHTRRSRWVFRRVLGARAERLRFVSVPTDNFAANCWWQSSEGFSVYTTEYLKLAFYLFWYGTAGWWLGAMLVVVAAIWVWRRAARSKAAQSSAKSP
jgi:uncharacterized SAM-binding protein YcdF (DUF218 family)